MKSFFEFSNDFIVFIHFVEGGDQKNFTHNQRHLIFKQCYLAILN